MATFQIPGEIITSVTALGGGAPPSGYYAAKIEKIEPHPSRATARRMTLSFQGFSCTDWLNTPYDVEGKAIAGLNEKQVRGMVAAIKSVFLSAGYSNEQMSQGISDDWLIDKSVWLEWHAAKDLGATYGKIDRYITQVSFDTFQADGSKPAVAGADAVSSSSASAAVPPAVAAATPAPAATVAPAPVPAPSNGASQTTIGGAVLPPPPVGAQGLTQ